MSIRSLSAVLLLAALAIPLGPPARAAAPAPDLPSQQQVAALAAPAAPISLNPTFRELALAQGVPIGSINWTAGGLHPFSGQTGSSPAYGWRHEHLLSATWVREVIANYAARPAFYDHAPCRETAYYVGSRPAPWSTLKATLSMPGDTFAILDDGKGGTAQAWGVADFGGVQVSGPDLEHFPLSPLFAVAGSHGFTIAKPGVVGGVPAEDVARTMVRYLMAAQAGMLRKPDGKLTTYVCADRVARYITGNLAGALTLDAIDPADAATLTDYVRLRLVPHWTGPPDNSTEKGGDLQVYNGVCWAVPALYDLAVVTPPGIFRRQLVAALQIQCKKLALLALLVPGHSCQVDTVTTWTGLTAAGIATTDYIGPWEVRSMLVAGVILCEPACTAEGMTEAARWKGDASQAAWLRKPDGSPITWN